MPDALHFREAARSDLERLVELLADDALGARRERLTSPLPKAYALAFEAISEDPNQHLLVAEADGMVVGLLQLSLLPGLTHQGAWRAQIEGVRVARAYRSRGVGRKLLAHAMERARRHGCRIVQLTTDKTRPEALAFYRSLGFIDSHEGMKRPLGPGDP